MVCFSLKANIGKKMPKMKMIETNRHMLKLILVSGDLQWGCFHYSMSFWASRVYHFCLFRKHLYYYLLGMWQELAHSGSSGGWEERSKLREKATMKFINITLPIVPATVKIKLIQLGSWNFTWSSRFTIPNFHQKTTKEFWALRIAAFCILLNGHP